MPEIPRVQDVTMTISAERQKELEPLSIRVYQQLQAGYPIDAIKSQFDRIEEVDPDEVQWVLTTGKQRYIGYYVFYRRTHRNEAKWTIIGSLAIFLIVLLVLTAYGWPAHGRGRGIAMMGILIGLGGAAYGAWTWITAEPSGRRRDIDAL